MRPNLGRIFLSGTVSFADDEAIDFQSLRQDPIVPGRFGYQEQR